MILPLLSLDSLGLGLIAAAHLQRPRDRAIVAAVFGLVDAVATAVSPVLAHPAVTAAAVVAIWGAFTAALVGWTRDWRLWLWLGVAGLGGIDNLMTPALPGDALPAGLFSGAAAGIAMALGGMVATGRTRARAVMLAGLAVAAAGVLS